MKIFIVQYLMLDFLKKKIQQIIDIFSAPKKYPYVIEEINIQENLAIIRCVGTRVVIKFSLEEVVSDLSIISGLPPNQACILGGCYGRLMRGSHDRGKKLRNAEKMTFSLSNKQGNYIILFQHRNGDLGYLNKKTRQEFIESPLSLVNHDYIISEFDSSEACYIGILAGSSLEKALISGKHINVVEKLIQKPPLLRVVK